MGSQFSLSAHNEALFNFVAQLGGRESSELGYHPAVDEGHSLRETADLVRGPNRIRNGIWFAVFMMVGGVVALGNCKGKETPFDQKKHICKFQLENPGKRVIVIPYPERPWPHDGCYAGPITPYSEKDYNIELDPEEWEMVKKALNEGKAKTYGEFMTLLGAPAQHYQAVHGYDGKIEVRIFPNAVVVVVKRK